MEDKKLLSLYPLTREEMHDFMLDYWSEQEITEAINKYLKESMVWWRRPINRNEETLTWLKLAFKIDMPESRASLLAWISRRTLSSWKNDIWLLSEKLCHHIEKWKDNIETIAKLQMVHLLQKWDPRVVMHVLQSKDDRYNPAKIQYNDNRIQHVQQIDEDLKAFIIDRANKWPKPIQMNNLEDEKPNS